MAATTDDTWLQWLVQTNDVKQLWAAQPTYILSQSVYILAGLVTLLHAFCKGGRWPYLWLGTILHGLFTDNFWHFVLPEYDNFWHSQTPLIFLGARLPLHIILLYFFLNLHTCGDCGWKSHLSSLFPSYVRVGFQSYPNAAEYQCFTWRDCLCDLLNPCYLLLRYPAFIYHAVYAVSRLNLPKYAEPFAVGLVTVLVDLPYDITAVKFVHWTWHDTDPNIYDRHYWVPWNSYYFHATFAASFYFFFIASRSWFAPKVAKWDSADKKSEWKALLISSLLGMPGGVLLFVPIYHPLHDVFKIHSEVTFFLLFAIFAVIVFTGLMTEREVTAKKLTRIDYVLLLQLAIHYLLYLSFTIFFNPEDEWSLGLHEPVGPCKETSTLTTPFGQVLEKRKYFCPTDFDEGYFDFHCVKELPVNGATWYVVCGTPFENRAEYVTVLSTILIVATGVFYSLFFKTGGSPAVTPKKLKKK